MKHSAERRAFDKLVGQVLSVSHDEIMRREAEYQRRMSQKPIRTGPGPMYRQVQAEVKRADGIKVKTRWIADVKEQLGMSNGHKGERRDPCPDDKRAAIVDAMLRLGLIPA